MSDKYILKGRTPVPVDDLLEWARWFENADRHVKLSEQGDVRVSTVFLGLDHSWGGDRPVLFETMVFGVPGLDVQDRYCTWEEAEAGHDRRVMEVFKATPILALPASEEAK